MTSRARLGHQFLGLLLGLVALVPSLSARPLPSRALLVQYLDNVMLRSEYQGPRAGLSRFESGLVTWAVIGSSKNYVADLVESTFGYLQTLTTNVQFHKITNPVLAQIVIYCGPSSGFAYPREVRANFVGYARLQLSLYYSIIQANIFVDPTAPTTQLERIVHEEVMHSLGFPNDAPLGLASVTTTDTWNPTFSELDGVWFMLLYSPLISAGATRSEALQVLARLPCPP